MNAFNNRLFSEVVVRLLAVTGRDVGAWHFIAYGIDDYACDHEEAGTKIPASFRQGNRILQCFMIKFLPRKAEYRRINLFPNGENLSEELFLKFEEEMKRVGVKPGKILPREMLQNLANLLNEQSISAPQRDAIFLKIAATFRQAFLFPKAWKKTVKGNWHVETDIGAFFLTESAFLEFQTWEETLKL